MQNLENLDVFEILITQELLKCPKDPFVRSMLIYFQNSIPSFEKSVNPDQWPLLKPADQVPVFIHTINPYFKLTNI